MKYNCILIDADNTLWDFDKAEAEAFSCVLKKNGIPATKENIKLYHEINDAMWKLLEIGQITKDRLKIKRFEDFCKEVGSDADPKQIADDYLIELSKRAYLLPGALEMCEELSNSASLYILTNGVKYVQLQRFNNSPIKQYIKNILISEELGYEKPKKEYFSEVENRIGNFDFSKTLMVGDSLSSDIKGGINYGLDTCWFNPKGKEKPNDMNITYVVKTYDEIIRIAKGNND